MKNINLKTIRIDGGTQSRVELNGAALVDYTQALRDGVELPPVVVFFDGVDNWLADGFHRYHAYLSEERASIPSDIRNGSARDAVLFSVGANGTHGLRRTNEDKRKSVRTMLADEIWSKWSERDIAQACNVGRTFVATVRAELAACGQVDSAATYPQGTSQVKIKKEAPGFAAPEQADEPERDGPSADEISEAEQSAAEDLATAQKLLASDQPLADAVAENKRLKALVKSLELRITGLINEKDAAIRSAKSWQRKYERAESAA